MSPRLRPALFASVAGLFAVALLAGCGQQGPLVSDYWSSETPGSNAPVTPGDGSDTGAGAPDEAVLGDYVARAPTFAPFNSEGEITFSLAADNVAFRANCNPHMGTPEWIGDNLRVRQISKGKMACPSQSATNQDTWLKRFFNRPLTLTPTDTGVLVSDGHTDLAFSRTAPDSAAQAISGHEWRLVRAGSVDDPQDVADLKVRLQVSGDQVEFGDGCNTGGASVIVTEETLQLSDAMSTMKACQGEPVETLQKTVREVLSRGEVTWGIEDDTLRLERDGRVLEYRQA